jgi:MoaA/NifB/PqqE/SkfB family radical SAM enzyme
MTERLQVLSDSQTGVPRLPPSQPSTGAVRFGEGFFWQEHDKLHPFRWMDRVGEVTFEPSSDRRFLESLVLSDFYDLSQELAVESGAVGWSGALLHGWNRMSFEVPPGADRVSFRASKLFPKAYYPEDTRTLSMRLSEPGLHADAARHAAVRRQYENGVANHREMLAGASRLGSYPQSLGIDMYGVCNVKPPCVYCEWDLSKKQEGANVDVPFDTQTLDEFGEFFDRPSYLVNCSIGEPFMMKEFDDLLDRFGDAGKVLELTTNGQILTERNIQKLLGRDIHLYISLDAATPETYGKLRNDKFDRILVNLRRLVAAKGGKGKLPLIYLVFMPMRVNVREAKAFVELCADLGVDMLVLRPLNYSEEIALDWQRSGYHFQYKNELLPFEELVRTSAVVAQHAARLGVALSDQMDFGGDMAQKFPQYYAEEGPATDAIGATVAPPPAPDDTARPEPRSEPMVSGPLPSLGAENLPACLEPWKSLYILRRGVFPCCYGGEAVAPMNGYREAWNSPLLQAIRGELAAGRFHEYCLKSPACPIVRKVSEAGELPSHDTRYVNVRRLWHQANRALGGVPSRLLRPLKGVVVRWLKN